MSVKLGLSHKRKSIDKVSLLYDGMLRGFRSKEEEVSGDWRKSHTNQMKGMSWAGACGAHGRDDKCIQSSGLKS
jgi:hypothetical protein